MTAKKNNTTLAQLHMTGTSDTLTKFKGYQLTNLGYIYWYPVCTYWASLVKRVVKRFTLPKSVAREGDREGLATYSPLD